MMIEKWLPIAGFEGYEVSDFGNVKCVKMGQGRRVGRNLHPNTSSTGYRQVRIRKDGKSWTLFVHKLVMTAFVGERPEGLQIRHLDGNKDNNALSNLAYGTAKENGQDKVRHGRTSKGEKNVKAKLDELDVQIIRVLHQHIGNSAYIAKMYGLSKSTVCRIVNGMYWSHVEAA